MFYLSTLLTALSTVCVVLSAAIPSEVHVRAPTRELVRKGGPGWSSWPIKPKIFILSLVRSSETR